MNDWAELVNEVLAASFMGRGRPARVEGPLSMQQAVEMLLGFLREDDYSKRTRAAQALSRVGAPAIDGLVRLLAGSLWYTRESVIRALSGIDDARAVEPVMRGLLEDNVGIQRAALEGAARFAAGPLACHVGRALSGWRPDERELLLTRVEKQDARLRSYLEQLRHEAEARPTRDPEAEPGSVEPPAREVAVDDEAIGRALERFRARWRRSTRGGAG